MSPEARSKALPGQKLRCKGGRSVREDSPRDTVHQLRERDRGTLGSAQRSWADQQQAAPHLTSPPT